MVSESYPCTGSVGSSSSLSLCEVDTEPKVVTEILCLRGLGLGLGSGLGLGVGFGLELIILGTLSLYYYAHSITPC